MTAAADLAPMLTVAAAEPLPDDELERVADLVAAILLEAVEAEDRAPAAVVSTPKHRYDMQEDR